MELLVFIFIIDAVNHDFTGVTVIKLTQSCGYVSSIER